MVSVNIIELSQLCIQAAMAILSFCKNQSTVMLATAVSDVKSGLKSSDLQAYATPKLRTEYSFLRVGYRL